jgi:hypothetical protein
MRFECPSANAPQKNSWPAFCVTGKGRSMHLMIIEHMYYNVKDSF